MKVFSTQLKSVLALASWGPPCLLLQRDDSDVSFERPIPIAVHTIPLHTANEL